MTVGSNSITGRLFYNEGWESGPLEGPGYYLALAFESDDWSQYDSVKVGLYPSMETGLVEIIDDPDKNGVFKINPSNSQSFVVEVTKGEETLRKLYSLSDLVRGFISTPNMTNQTCWAADEKNIYPIITQSVTQSGVYSSDNVAGSGTNYTGIISGAAYKNVIEDSPIHKTEYFIGFEVQQILTGGEYALDLWANDEDGNVLRHVVVTSARLRENNKVALKVGEVSDLANETPELVKSIKCRVTRAAHVVGAEPFVIECVYSATISTPAPVVVPDSLVTTPDMVAQTCAYPAQQTVAVTQSSIALQDNVDGYGEEFTGTISGQVYGYVDPNEETQYRLGFKLNETLIKSTSQIDFKLYDANNNEINLGGMAFSGSEIPADGYIAISVGSTNIGPADPEDIKSIVASYVDFTDTEDVKFITVTYTTNLTKGS